LKKLFSLLTALLMGFSLNTCAIAEEPEPEPDWLELMTEAAAKGDREAGLKAAEGWNAGAARSPIDYDELVLLAKLIQWEAGSSWLSEELRMCVGEVALNRVASPEFPDTLEGVIYQYGQYVGADTPAFRYYLIPSRPCVEAALRVLQGERLLEPQVVFEGHEIQGKVHSAFIDLHYGKIYFCESHYPELYIQEEEEEASAPALFGTDRLCANPSVSRLPF
jgi:hypothetical protein